LHTQWINFIVILGMETFFIMYSFVVNRNSDLSSQQLTDVISILCYYISPTKLQD